MPLLFPFPSPFFCFSSPPPPLLFTGISWMLILCYRGLVGPQRLFSQGAQYSTMVYAALIGAILPIPLWLWVRRNPRSILRNLNLPVLINGPLGIPPANGVNYASWLVVGFVFQFYLRRRKFAWWSKVSLSSFERYIRYVAYEEYEL